MGRTIFFDVESHSASKRWHMPPREFVRLFQWSEGWDGDVHITSDYDEMIDVIESASTIVGHNIHAFDLSVLYGKHSPRPLELALMDRVFDTWTHATLHMPAPYTYTDRSGRTWKRANKPGNAMRWFGLDNMAYQLGVQGKLGNLKDLAKEFAPVELIMNEDGTHREKLDIDEGFGRIPLDNPEFLDYAKMDVEVTRAVARELLRRGPYNHYAKTAQQNAAIDAQNSRNGFRVDQDAARERVAYLDRKRDEHFAVLVRDHNMPTPESSKAPLRTKAGKLAIANALNTVGISLDDLPRTKDSNGVETERPSLGGPGLLQVSQGRSEGAVSLCQAIAAIGGLRPLAASALKHTQPDGFVHPEISTLQSSGRKSTTNPGLTVWTSRGVNAVEKSYFVPDVITSDEFSQDALKHDRWLAEGSHVLMEFDLSQADARIVAAYSGDEAFAMRFAEGVDAHMLTAEAIWGYDVVHASKDSEKHYRQIAKACGHAYAFRAGPGTIAKTAKVSLAIATKFVNTMQRLYPKVTRWQNRVTKEAERGYVTNAWGRRMRIDRGREYNQGPAMYGQSGTMEIINDALRRMPIHILRCLKAQVHDALVFSFPKSKVDEYSKIVVDCMQVTWQPPDGTGQAVFFPVGMSTSQDSVTWFEASH